MCLCALGVAHTLSCCCGRPQRGASWRARVVRALCPPVQACMRQLPCGGAPESVRRACVHRSAMWPSGVHPFFACASYFDSRAPSNDYDCQFLLYVFADTSPRLPSVHSFLQAGTQARQHAGAHAGPQRHAAAPSTLAQQVLLGSIFVQQQLVMGDAPCNPLVLARGQARLAIAAAAATLDEHSNTSAAGTSRALARTRAHGPAEPLAAQEAL